MKKGDTILVRDSESDLWKKRIFSHLDNKEVYPYVCTHVNGGAGLNSWKFGKEIDPSFKKGDTILVTDYEIDNASTLAVFDGMYDGKYLCKEDTSSDRFVLWKYAKVCNPWIDVEPNRFPNVDVSEDIEVLYSNGETSINVAHRFYWGLDTKISRYRVI